jgi:hypothetical protein
MPDGPLAVDDRNLERACRRHFGFVPARRRNSLRDPVLRQIGAAPRASVSVIRHLKSFTTTVDLGRLRRRDQYRFHR